MSGVDEENIDQVALRKWIVAGLSIPEVVALNGDAGYLLNNMIAKYTLASSRYEISKLALKKLQSQGVDLTRTYPRRTFYGKQGGRNPFIYEHTIPAGVVRKQLLKNSGDQEKIKEILGRAGQVAVLLREEDEKIRKAGLTSRMPDGWRFGDDYLSRYRAVCIFLSDKFLKVSGAICR